MEALQKQRPSLPLVRVNLSTASEHVRHKFGSQTGPNTKWRHSKEVLIQHPQWLDRWLRENALLRHRHHPQGPAWSFRPCHHPPIISTHRAFAFESSTSALVSRTFVSSATRSIIMSMQK